MNDRETTGLPTVVVTVTVPLRVTAVVFGCISRFTLLQPSPLIGLMVSHAGPVTLHAVFESTLTEPHAP